MSESESALSQLWRNPWVTWVGYRYLKSKKHSRFLSFITFISIAGVGLGVTAMLVVLSVMDGFEAELKKRLMTSDLHILVTPTKALEGYDAGFVDAGALEKTGVPEMLRKEPTVVSAWPILSTEAILKTGRKVTGVVLKGIHQERMARLKKQMRESAEPQLLHEKAEGRTERLPGIFVGQELAYELGVIPGDFVTLVSPTETDGPLGTVPRMKKFVIEGVYHSGLPEQELHTAFTADQHARSFLRRPDVLTQWEITLKDFDSAPALASRIRAMAPGFLVQDWVQLNSRLFASLKLERVAMFVILAFIIIVASFNIVTTLTLMVLEKKREISILKAMGARDSQVAAIFLSEGLLIGSLGVLLGVVLGALLCVMLKRYEFITLPDVYYDRTLPVTFNPVYYVLVPICALVIVVVACLYPSRRAARLNPLDGIRYG